MSNADADLDDAELKDREHLIDGDLALPDTTPIITPNERSSDLIHWCIKNLPTPPAHYRFSQWQRMEQYDFFLHRNEAYPTRFLDMYNATIVVACKTSCYPINTDRVEILSFFFSHFSSTSSMFR